MLFKKRLALKASLVFFTLLVTVILSLNITSVIASGNTPQSCAVTPDKLEGQGLNVTQLGLNVTQLGLNVTQLGLNVTGLGLNVTQLGLNVTQLGQTPEQIVGDITKNIVTPAWLTSLLPDIQGGEGYNGTKTAVLIADDFSAPTAHGFDVRKVYVDLMAAVSPTPNVTLHNVDISTQAIGYNSTGIATAISNQVNTLSSQGYKHFVINMSFGLLPCANSNDVTLTDSETGQQFTVTNNFDFAQYESLRNKATNPANLTNKVLPILECVVKHSHNSYTAYFGYHNFNPLAVTIPLGVKNQFTPSPQNRGQPTSFGAGRQDFVFAVPFNGNNLTWVLKGPDGVGRNVTATKQHNQSCAYRGLTPPAQGSLTIVPTGLSISQYATDVVGVPQKFVDEYFEYLATTVDESPIAGLRTLIRGYLERSYDEMVDGNPDTIFAVIPVASSGNFRHLFGETPLKPSFYAENVAVGATLGDFGNQWVLSHSGNILAPGAGYPFEFDAAGKISRIGAGTSFAGPFVGALSSLWLTYPSACVFGDGLPPLASFATNKFAEATARVGAPSPLACAKPVVLKADLSISKSAAPEPVFTGQPLTYTITVANNGPAPAANVVVSDTLPAGVTLVGAQASQGSCVTTTCSLGAIANGSSATVQIVVNAPASAGSIINTASVTSDTEDPNAANNTASATTTVLLPLTPVLDCVADLGGGLYRAFFGYNNPNAAAVNIAVSAANNGFSPAPENRGQPTTFQPGLQANAFAVDFDGSALTWKLVSATATASSDPSVRCADVSISKTGPANAVIGDQVFYTITVTNTSGRTVNNIVVTDVIPLNIQPFSSDAICTFSNATRTKTCTVGTLTAGQSRSFHIVLIANQAGTVVNTATMTSDEGVKGNPNNNSSTASTVVSAPVYEDSVIVETVEEVTTEPVTEEIPVEESQPEATPEITEEAPSE